MSISFHEIKDGLYSHSRFILSGNSLYEYYFTKVSISHPFHPSFRTVDRLEVQRSVVHDISGHMTWHDMTWLNISWHVMTWQVMMWHCMTDCHWQWGKKGVFQANGSLVLEPLGTDLEEVPWRRNNCFFVQKESCEKREIVIRAGR